MSKLQTVFLLLLGVTIAGADSVKNPPLSKVISRACLNFWYGVGKEKPAPATIDDPAPAGWWRQFSDSVKLKLGKGTRKVSPETYALFERFRENPDLKLEPEEMAAHEKRLKEEGKWELFENYRNTGRVLKALNHWRGLNYRSKLHDGTFASVKDFDQSLGDLVASPLNFSRYRFAKLYAKVAETPTHELKSTEISGLKKNGLWKDFEKFRAEAAAGKLPESYKDEAKLKEQWRKELKSGVIGTFFKASTIPLRSIYRLLGLPTPLYNARLAALEKKLLDNPKADLSKEDWGFIHKMTGFDPEKFIESHDLEKDIERYRKDAETMGEDMAKRRFQLAVAKKIYWTGFFGALGLATVPDRIITSVDADDDTDEKKKRRKRTAELVFNTAFPEVAVRVGDNYYLLNDLGVAPEGGAGEDEAEKSGDDARTFPLTENEEEKEYTKRQTKLGTFLDGAKTRVEIVLTDEQLGALATLEAKRSYKKHINAPPLDNGISEMNRDMKKVLGISVPPLLNRSHAGTIAYYRALKLSGDKRVGEIVFETNGDNPYLRKGQDLGVSFLELSLMSEWPAMIMGANYFADEWHKDKEKEKEKEKEKDKKK